MVVNIAVGHGRLTYLLLELSVDFPRLSYAQKLGKSLLLHQLVQILEDLITLITGGRPGRKASDR